MLYLVLFYYYPNTAPTNRVMGYVKALSELGIKAKVVFFAPDKNRSKVTDYYPNIEFVYLWEKWFISFPYLRSIFLRLYLKHFINYLKAGDKVYVYGFPDLVVSLAKRKDIQIFAERTEHNSVSFVCHIKQVSVSDFLEACRHIQGIIVISEGLRKYYIENGCNEEKVHLVNMIVDINRFIGIEKQQSEPYIAYCGTISNNKDGVDVLIKAFALVVKRIPNIKLLIIGNLPSKQQNCDYFKEIKKLGIKDNVVFKGLVSYSDMPQLLKNATVLALARPDNLQSKYGFPTKLGEYLLTANPVVITQVGDIPLFLKDGKSALISAPSSPLLFAEKICWVFDHPSEAVKIGEQGKMVAIENFNYLTETKKILKILETSK